MWFAHETILKKIEAQPNDPKYAIYKTEGL